MDVLDLGRTNLSGFVKQHDTDTLEAPLTLAIGPWPHLVQLRHSVSPELLYTDYFYRSSNNEQMVAHLRQMAVDIHSYLQPEDKRRHLDIGANDGTLMGAFHELGYYSYGIDPSNTALAEHVPEILGERIITDYFRERHYHPRSFDVITSASCFYDVDDPLGFARDIATLLTSDGVWVTEQHYLGSMLELNEYEAICHEHLTYWSLTALAWVCDEVGLRVDRVEFNGVNGGSFRAYVTPHATRRTGRSDDHATVERVLEKEAGLDVWGFAERVKMNRELLRSILYGLSAQNKVVAGLGASTKAATIYQYCNITPRLVAWISERMEEKFGLETSGTHIPIISEKLSEIWKPDYYLVGPYHFLDSIMARERAFNARGGVYIIPVPHPHFVRAS